jgi:two-component system sensor histidine kinase RegB
MVSPSLPAPPATPPATGIIRLKTLLRMRAWAIAGQIGALMVAAWGLDIAVPLPACLVVVSTSLLFNLFLSWRLRQAPYVHDGGAALSLAFDTLQLALLLHLSGGLGNPFAILMLAPMVVGATILTGRSLIVLGLLGLLSLTLLLFFSAPLAWPSMPPPPLFIFGVYIALLISGIFLVLYVRKVARDSRRLFEALSAGKVELARMQKIAGVGAVAAAVAHELGSPLSTIAVVAGELKHELKGTAQESDAALLQSEVARCRHILHEFSAAAQMDGAGGAAQPLRRLIQNIAAPYVRDTVSFRITVLSGEGEEPQWQPSPPLLHGLANLLQNALSFARSEAWVEIFWQGQEVRLGIMDDGPGFPPDALPRLGGSVASGRGGEGHAGLGLFIAKTLLERSGATLSFSNRQTSDGRVLGASATVHWQQQPVEG